MNRYRAQEKTWRILRETRGSRGKLTLCERKVSVRTCSELSYTRHRGNCCSRHDRHERGRSQRKYSLCAVIESGREEERRETRREEKLKENKGRGQRQEDKWHFASSSHVVVVPFHDLMSLLQRQKVEENDTYFMSSVHLEDLDSLLTVLLFWTLWPFFGFAS